MSERDPSAVADRITPSAFDAWYTKRRRRENARLGKFHRNVPTGPPPEDVVFPSSLLCCHRKQYYREHDAPAERRPPHGHFWVGSNVETEVVLPFLEAAVTETTEYVRNSRGLAAPGETGTDEVRHSGSTDPMLPTSEGRILLPTEVKTVADVGSTSLPREHHRAQLHAYLHGLSASTGESIDAGLIIYLGKSDFSLAPFFETFDEAFWTDRVVPWMEAHRAYRTASGIPPATPEQAWECDRCEFRHRCGKTDGPVSDAGPAGFVPTVRYPRSEVEYLRRDPDVALTPTVAGAYPDLAAGTDVREWACPACGTRVEFGTTDWDGDPENRPVCPSCTSAGEYVPLAGTPPSRQSVIDLE